MLKESDVKKVVEVVGNNLIGVSHDSNNFRGFTGDHWGYYARGHDEKGFFGVILTYSESESDVDHIMKLYKEWAAKK